MSKTEKNNALISFIDLTNFIPLGLLVIGFNGLYANYILSVIFALFVVGYVLYTEYTLRKNEELALLQYFHKILMTAIIGFIVFCFVVFIEMNLARDPSATGGVSNNSIVIIFVALPLTFIFYFVFTLFMVKRNRKFLK